MVLPSALTEHLYQYAQMRAEALLQEHAFHHREIAAIINSEVTGTIDQAVADFITPLLATKQMSLDAHLRLSLKP